MKWLREHSLGVVLFVLFFIFLVGQSVTGHVNYNQEQEEHQASQISYGEYVVSGNFIESVFENWESEFLQMGAYVILTTFLVYKGSAESKKLRGNDESDRTPRKSDNKAAPGPVRRGGWMMKMYEHSLSLAFLLIFLLAFALHAYGGARETCEENLQHGGQCVTMPEYVTTAKFWFESFQNWQSEFLAVFALVVLTVYLREKGSTQSKPVNTPHYQTGAE
jgi:hypothetical protein